MAKYNMLCTKPFRFIFVTIQIFSTKEIHKQKTNLPGPIAKPTVKNITQTILM